MLKMLFARFALIATVFLGMLTFPASAQVPRDAYTAGPEYVVIAQSRYGSPALFRVSFRGHINHGEHYGSGRCSWKHDAIVNANIKLIRSTFPVEETIQLWRSDQGSHYRGLDGTCGRNRSQIDGNWHHARTNMDSKARGGITLFRTQVEDFLRSKQPAFTRFVWRLPPDNFNWETGSIAGLSDL